MGRLLRSLLVLACVVVAADGNAEPAAPGASPDPAHAPPVSRAEVERLQALGYVDVAAEPVQDGRSGVVVHDVARSYPGYNLFTNAHLCSTQLIDADGKVVRTWSLTPCFRWDNTSLLPNGDLLVIGREQKSPSGDAEGGAAWSAGRYVARLGWNGEVIWRTPLGAHHDAQLTPRDQIAVLTATRRQVAEVDDKRKLKDDALTLLTPGGEVIASASLYDLLKTAPGGQFHFEPRTQGKGHLDLLHANSVFWMNDAKLAARNPLYAPANVLVTIRHQDTLAVIDWDRKKVVWAWGQGELSGPHDGVVLPSGNFLVFDNGLGRGWSRVVELDPLARRIVWQYRAAKPESFYSQTRGANQRLPNGNTLIAQSDSGRAFEVTPDGEIVWEFLNPNLSDGRRGALVRLRRLETSVVDAWLARDAANAGRAASAAAPGAH
jgi:hypothetical protein